MSTTAEGQRVFFGKSFLKKVKQSNSPWSINQSTKTSMAATGWRVNHGLDPACEEECGGGTPWENLSGLGGPLSMGAQELELWSFSFGNLAT